MNLKKLPKNQKELSEMINLIPMINLIFLLLIFFLLTGVVGKKEKNETEKPISEFGQEKKNMDVDIIFTINSNNQIIYEDNEIDLIKVREILSFGKKRYVIDIDKNSNIHKFNSLIKEIKKNNIEKVFVKVNDKQDEK